MIAAPTLRLESETASTKCQSATRRRSTVQLGLLEDHEVPAPPRAPELETLTPWAPQARYDLDTEGAVLDREAVVELVHAVREWAQAELHG